jgi:protein-disulfide isomerase
VPVEELMKAGDLPDVGLGPADAKVTIVEYASLTCGHCAAFHNTVFPDLKKKYIDTGKVRFILREFPLDDRAAAAAMLARCAGGERTYPLVETLFATQADWAFIKESPVEKLFELSKQAGFTRSSFDACLTNQTLLDQITAVRSKAAQSFGVNSTPTFFVNGKRLPAPTLAEFEKAIDDILAKG